MMKLPILAGIILTANIQALMACPCFNHHQLIQHFKSQPSPSCHVLEVRNSEVVSIRLENQHHSANASTESCHLTTPFRQLDNVYLSYQRSHQNCITEIIRACKELKLTIHGADAELKAKMHPI